MEKTSVDTNDADGMDSTALDKECSALSALFQQIINEMKVRSVLHINSYLKISYIIRIIRMLYILRCF